MKTIKEDIMAAQNEMKLHYVTQNFNTLTIFVLKKNKKNKQNLDQNEL